MRGIGVKHRSRSAGLVLAAAALTAVGHASAGASDDVTAFAVSTAYDKRTATLRFSGGGAGCRLQAASFDVPEIAPPPGVVFPDGMLDFRAANCAPASTLRFTLTFSTLVPSGAKYWRYGRTAADRSPHWYDLPVAIDGNAVSFAIVDGGLGDDDLAANGVVGGPGGIGVGVVPVPQSPQALVAVAGNDHVSLRWNAVEFATGYTLKRGTRHGGPYTVIATQPGTSFTDEAKANGAIYYYTVSASNSAGESADATEVSAAPVAVKVATACGVEPVTYPRARPCPRYTAGTIVEQEVYVCQGTRWQSTGWRVKESACEPVDMGSSPVIEN